MKILKAFLIPICIYGFFIGLWGVIESISDGSFNYVPLIWVIVSAGVLALIIFTEVRSKNKQPKSKSVSKPVVPKMSRNDFEKKLEKKLKNSKVILALAIFCSALFPLSIAAVSSGSEALSYFVVGLPLGVAGSIAFWAIYATKYHPLKVNQKILKNAGYSLDACLSGMDDAVITPQSRIICTENAMVFEKTLVVIPYSSVLWVYKREKSVNGIVVESYFMFHITSGESLAISVDSQELIWVLNTHSGKFPKDIIVGYGKNQCKRYKEVKKYYRHKR